MSCNIDNIICSCHDVHKATFFGVNNIPFTLLVVVTLPFLVNDAGITCIKVSRETCKITLFVSISIFPQ